jgi:DNA-binding response OmpR family regulator
MGFINSLNSGKETAKKKILVIDDEPSMLAMVEGHLSVNGYDVKSTHDSSKGITITHQWDPDLILLDIMMPVMDGYTVARRVREFTSTPIIVLSAKAEEKDILEGFNAGVDDYIVKLFSAQELLARTRAVLRRFERDNTDEYYQPVYEHGDLKIDLDGARVSLNGVEINTSATEFKLLKKLTVSMGKILTTEELLASVWGPDYRYDKSILWVSMSRLKQKIERDPKNPVHILTIKKVGYMMPEIHPDQDGSVKS